MARFTLRDFIVIQDYSHELYFIITSNKRYYLINSELIEINDKIMSSQDGFYETHKHAQKAIEEFLKMNQYDNEEFKLLGAL